VPRILKVDELATCEPAQRRIVPSREMCPENLRTPITTREGLRIGQRDVRTGDHRPAGQPVTGKSRQDRWDLHPFATSHRHFDFVLDHHLRQARLHQARSLFLYKQPGRSRYRLSRR
jgi:hypothetical protein